jgi:hypothetical protein
MSACVQALVCTEEGNRKGNVHVQAVWAQPFPHYPELAKDLAALLRTMCGFRPGATKPWNVAVVAHPENPAHKLTRDALFGYASKGRNQSPNYTYAHTVLPPALLMCPLTILPCMSDASLSATRTRRECVDACSMRRKNVSDAQYDRFNSSYDVFRQSLTANRIGLTHLNIFVIASNYARGVVPKYIVALETAIIWVLATRRYFLDSRMALMGNIYHAVALAMCVPTSSHPSPSPVLAIGAQFIMC